MGEGTPKVKTLLKTIFWVVIGSALLLGWGFLSVSLGAPNIIVPILWILILVTAFGAVGGVVWILIKLYEWIDDL